MKEHPLRNMRWSIVGGCPPVFDNMRNPIVPILLDGALAVVSVDEEIIDGATPLESCAMTEILDPVVLGPAFAETARRAARRRKYNIRTLERWQGSTR